MSKSIIGALRVSLGIDSAAFTKGLADSTSRMRRWGATVAKIGAGLSVASTGIALAVRRQLNAAEQIGQLAQVANTGTREFQRFAAAAKTVGVDNEKLSDILKDVSDRVGDFLQTGGGPMADFFEKIAPQVGVTAEQFRGLSGADALQLYVSSLEKANLSQSEMTFYLEAMASDTTRLLPLLSKGGAEMNRLADAAERAGVILSDDTIKAARQFNTSLGQIRDVIGGLVAQITAELAPIMARVAAVLVDWSQRFASLSPEVRKFAAVVAGVTVVAGPLAVALGAVLMVAAPLGAAITAILSPLGLAVAGFVALGAAATYVALRWDEIAAANPTLAEGVGGLAAPFAAVKTAIDEVALRAIPAMMEAGRAVSALFRGEFSAAGNLAASALRRLLGDLVAFNAQLGEGMIERIRGHWSLLGSIFSEAMESARAALESGFASITSVVSGWGEAFKQYGRDIVDGLSAGITEKWDSLRAGLRARSEALKSTFRDVFGIKSPSRVFKEYGQNISEGLAIGIEGGLPAAAQAMTAVSDALIGAGDSMASRFVSFRDTLQGAFTGLVTGALSFKDALRQVAASLAKMAAERAFQSIFSGAFKTGGGGGFLGNIFGALFGGFRAAGGPVSASRAYVVGERGPEMFVPRTAGAIVPNHKLGGGVEVIVRHDPSLIVDIARGEARVAADASLSMMQGELLPRALGRRSRNR